MVDGKTTSKYIMPIKLFLFDKPTCNEFKSGISIGIKPNEPSRGKPRGILKGKNHFIAASCGEFYPIDFAALLD